MSESGNGSLVWRPRHRGWNLAHHLLPTFLLIVFLGASGSYALLYGKPELAAALLASATALLLVVGSAFRRPKDYSPVENSAVETSTGQRAATWFPAFRTPAMLAALMVGLAVVVLVASIALSARFLFLHKTAPVVLAGALGVVLIGCGVYVLSRGLRMARIAAASQNPGIYLTRSRIVQYGSRGMQEIYWNDVSDVEAADPPRRQPLGKRGPAWIVVGCVDGTNMRVLVHELAADPDLLLLTLNHYVQNPELRAELGTDAALKCVTRLGKT